MHKMQHPKNNAVLGAPPGVPFGQVEALPVTRVQYSDGTTGILSYWRPTPQELALLNRGAGVRLSVLGTIHPPVSLGVVGDGLFEEVET